MIVEINYTVDSLLLYRAELGRVLGLKCDEVSDSRKPELLLKNNKIVKKTERFIFFFQLLEKKCVLEKRNMLNWFRADRNQLKTSPFYAIIDEGRFEEVINLLY